MEEILKTLLNDKMISEAADFFKRKKEFLVYGVSGSQKVATVAAMFLENPRPTMIVVENRTKHFCLKSKLKNCRNWI